MATYKVLQDIEAEDKLLGPLTLRQFIYAAIVIVLGFISFKLATATPFLVIPFLPPMIFFGMLAAPFGHDQSSEVWLLAKIRFFLKPRRRVWDQTGVEELVSITVPKKVEAHLTDGLTQSEVKSRLRALASTIDSRGWAVKNVNINLSTQPTNLDNSNTGSDRLVEGSSLPQEVPAYEILAADDIMDETNNPTAQHLDEMISQSEQAHRQTLVATVQGATQASQPPADYWFLNPSGGPVIAPGSKPAETTQLEDSSKEEDELLKKIHLEDTRPNPSYGHTKVVNPLGSNPTKHATNVTKPADNKATLARLATNDDLNIATIAREADKATRQLPDDEVTISLR